WRSLGWDSIVYFTAILAISPDLYEAATVDGAKRIDIIRYIILPALVVPMTTMFILNLGFFMTAGFDQVFNFTNLPGSCGQKREVRRRPPPQRLLRLRR
ncbi:ABC transporter permease subunit, partial [[Clostridium] symbiosum]|uniref:ABC transporter permease subunit n=1 Tax=Clostridium symbiosum TaxID=1512 RepID=UPI002109CC35